MTEVEEILQQQVTIPVAPVEPADKPGYKIVVCQDCGERRKLYKDFICEECWIALDEKKRKLERKRNKDK